MASHCRSRELLGVQKSFYEASILLACPFLLAISDYDVSNSVYHAPLIAIAKYLYQDWSAIPLSSGALIRQAPMMMSHRAHARLAHIGCNFVARNAVIGVS